MRQLLACWGMLTIAVSGCALCADPHDCKFGAYGGGRQRTDMVHGRVGSIFDPALEINRFADRKLEPHVEEDPWQAPLEDNDLIQPDDGSLDGQSDDSSTESDSNLLPELDGEGSIELPELDGGDELPDLPSTDSSDEAPLRSARRHPLSDLFDEDL